MEERLQKIIARAGVVSRRKAEEYIVQGRVKVNGQVVTELGAKADPARDHIKVDGKAIRPESFEYYAVHKPRNVLSAASDEGGRPVVTDLVRSGKRLYPAGRLDFNSEGLVIVTNDGDLAQRITRAGSISKVYRVKVRGQPEDRQLERLRRGFHLEGERFAPCQIQTRKIDNNCWLEVVLRQGLNRQIRRMFEAIGHPVMRLRRIAVGPVKLGRLAPRSYRELTPDEINELKGEKRAAVPPRSRPRRTAPPGKRTAGGPRRSTGPGAGGRGSRAERPDSKPAPRSESGAGSREGPRASTRKLVSKPGSRAGSRAGSASGAAPGARPARSPRSAPARSEDGRNRRPSGRGKPGSSRQRSS